MVIKAASWSAIDGQGKTQWLETFSMVFVMIWSSRTLPFLVSFSIALVKSYLLGISLYFRLMLSFSFMRFMLKSPMITTFDDNIDKILKIKSSNFVSQSFLAKCGWKITPRRRDCLLFLLPNSTDWCSNHSFFSVMSDQFCMI